MQCDNGIDIRAPEFRFVSNLCLGIDDSHEAEFPADQATGGEIKRLCIASCSPQCQPLIAVLADADIHGFRGKANFKDRQVRPVAVDEQPVQKLDDQLTSITDRKIFAELLRRVLAIGPAQRSLWIDRSRALRVAATCRDNPPGGYNVLLLQVEGCRLLRGQRSIGGVEDCDAPDEKPYNAAGQDGRLRYDR